MKLKFFSQHKFMNLEFIISKLQGRAQENELLLKLNFRILYEN